MLSIAMLVYAITREIEEMTVANVGALLRNTTGDFEVRLLINGGPVIALPPHPNLVPIYMAERSSIAQAYNLAFSGAAGDTLACVHNDVEVPPGWNEPLVAASRDGFAFPRVIEDAEECASRGIGPTQAGFPTGCCFAFPRSVYDVLMGFDEAYEGCHFEDTDLWMRGMDLGFHLRRANVAVKHGRGRTRTLLEDTGNSDFNRNRLIYADKHRRADGSVHIPSLQE